MVTGRNRFLASATLAAVALLLVAPSASSAPPPPRFWDFRVTNESGVTVKNISVELHAADEAGGYAGLEPEPIIVSVSRLPAGKTLTIGSDMGNAGIYGIAKIVVRAECPNGKSLSSPLVIEATQGQYEPSTQHHEYSGFCLEAPPGQTNHIPGVNFRPSPKGGYEGWLHGCSRWDAFWSPVIEATQPFTR